MEKWENGNFCFPRFTYVCGSVKRTLGSIPTSGSIPSLGLFSKVLYESGSLSIAVIFRDWIKGLLRFHPFLTTNKKRFTTELSFMFRVIFKQRYHRGTSDSQASNSTVRNSPLSCLLHCSGTTWPI